MCVYTTSQLEYKTSIYGGVFHYYVRFLEAMWSKCVAPPNRTTIGFSDLWDSINYHHM